MPLFDPQSHPDWVSPHSFAWYAQLGKLTGKYDYDWQSTLVEPNGESRFTEEVARAVQGKHVLDIGCGHGEYAMRWSGKAASMTGIDVTDEFVHIGHAAAGNKIRFVKANTKLPLPFADGSFDFAYNRRGPTSAYLDVRRVLRQEATLLGLHPGDALGVELPRLFPGFFDSKPVGTPILNQIAERLGRGGLKAEIETIRSVEWFRRPIELVRMRCFGQLPTVLQAAVEKALPEIQRIFDRHTEAEGLAVTHERYLVRAKV